MTTPMLPKIKSKIKSFFPALRYPNFRLYFVGQAISLVGTWLQQMAEQWLVYAILTNSKIALGILSAAQSLPITFLSLFAGVIIDRYNKRKIILYSQVLMMILAFVSAYLIQAKLIQFWQVVVMGVLLGVANSFDWPARQSFWPEIVSDKKDVTSVVALNSAIFNAARAIGPAVAAVAIGVLGIAPCYILNGISFLAAIIALILIKTQPVEKPKIKQPFFQNLKGGFSYLKHHREPLLLILLMASVGIFVLSFSTLLPVYAKDILKGNEKTFGMLGVAMGIGATLGAMTAFPMAEKLGKPKLLWITGLIMISSLFIFCLSRTLILSLIFLVIMGCAYAIFNTCDNSLIQEIIPDEVRGRVMSIYVFMWGGTAPFGSLYVAFLANYVGVSFSIIIGLVMALLIMLVVFKRFRLRERLEVILVTSR